MALLTHTLLTVRMPHMHVTKADFWNILPYCGQESVFSMCVVLINPQLHAHLEKHDTSGVFPAAPLNNSACFQCVWTPTVHLNNHPFSMLVQASWYHLLRREGCLVAAGTSHLGWAIGATDLTAPL